jgi:hypothetical protein
MPWACWAFALWLVLGAPVNATESPGGFSEPVKPTPVETRANNPKDIAETEYYIEQTKKLWQENFGWQSFLVYITPTVAFFLTVAVAFVFFTLTSGRCNKTNDQLLKTSGLPSR